MRNRLVEGKEPLEQSGPMGKGKRAKKRRPFLEEDDDVEQSEERPSKTPRPESSSSTDIIQKYRDLQKREEEGRSTAHTSTAGPSVQSSTTHLPSEDGGISTDAVCLDIKQAIKDRCNKATAAKYTNDPMHGLNTTACMAAHSATGLGASSRGDTTGYHIHVTASVKPEPVQMKDIIFCRGATLLPKMPSSPK
ncbi:hypothetical protein KUCAC02_032526, partial [Chaenocephalus aceratus]